MAAVDRAGRLDRRQRYLEGFTATLVKFRLMPSLADVTRYPATKRLAMAPARWMITPFPTDVTYADSDVPSRGGPLRVRVYTPPTVVPEQPPVVYIHGGGWVTGGLGACHWLCAHLASRMSAVVLSVEYRLAPEYRFPAAIEDCQDALAFLADQGPELGVDGTNVVVAGDSGGGNLAAALAYWDAHNERRIVQQLLIYPGLDLTMTSPSYSENRSPLLTRDVLAKTVEHYLGPDGDVKDPLVSPLLAESLEGLPRAVILTAEHDPLRDDGRLYAERLRDAGIPVEYRNYATMGHGFFSTPKLCRDSGQALTDLVELSRSQLT